MRCFRRRRIWVTEVAPAIRTLTCSLGPREMKAFMTDVVRGLVELGICGEDVLDCGRMGEIGFSCCFGFY